METDGSDEQNHLKDTRNTINSDLDDNDCTESGSEPLSPSPSHLSSNKSGLAPGSRSPMLNSNAAS